MAMKWAILIVSFQLSLALVPPLSDSTMEELAQYGFMCNETVRCDPTNFLICFNGICSCNNEDTIFNSEKSVCVAKANKACVVVNPVSLSRNVTLQAPGTQELQCVENANCDLDLKTCICSVSTWMASESGFCVPKKLINETCSTSNDCRQDYGLICTNNVCTCDLETTVHALYPAQGCLGQVEKPCIKNACTPFASCVDLEEGLIDPYQTITNSSSVTSSDLSEKNNSKVCQCNDDYYSTSRGRCSKDFGIKCDHVRHCKSGFHCVEGTCVCPYSTQVYNEAKGLCEAVVGGGCTANKSLNYQPDETVCIDGAICTKNIYRDSILINPPADNWMAGTCRCEEGLLANPSDGQCYLGFGQRCGVTKDDMNDSRYKCHDGARLACRNNQCQCMDNTYEYDKDVNMCVGLVGTTCDMLVNYWQLVPMPKGYVWKDGLPSGCTKGAVCVENAANRTLTTCQCAGRSVAKQKCSDKKFPGLAIIVIAVVLSVVAFITICFYFYLKAKGQLITEMVLADG